jgi:hypothetical protein
MGEFVPKESLPPNSVHELDQTETTKPETTPQTLYPKISGKVEEFIHAYRFRNGYLDQKTGQYMPGLPEDPLIEMIGTVKLHGTHADIVVYPDDSMRLQSRNRLSLDVGRDNYDCAKSLLPKRTEALNLRDDIVTRWRELNPGTKLDEHAPVIIAGEWIGPGVQKSVAIEKLPTRSFVILSISVNDVWLPSKPYGDICNEKAGIYNISRGGFFTAAFDINDPGPYMKHMNTLTLEVEACCPFAKSFSLSGIGEGIVWRPIRVDLCGDAKFWLKTKGPLHRVSNIDKVPKNMVDMESIERARTFAEATLTEIRLQQAWDYLGEMGFVKDKSSTQKFNGWLNKDIEMEEKGEIDRLGVDKQALRKAVVEIGRIWYFAKLEPV